jgi:hypothetical protein
LTATKSVEIQLRSFWDRSARLPSHILKEHDYAPVYLIVVEYSSEAGVSSEKEITPQSTVIPAAIGDRKPRAKAHAVDYR